MLKENNTDTKILPERNQYITRYVFFWMRILSIPSWGLIYLLTFILYKQQHISPLQITAIVALKPMSSLLAPYWSQMIHRRPGYLKVNLLGAHIFRYLPFVFVPWIESAWLIIIGFGLYMTLYRAAIPAWIEVIKRNVTNTMREQTVAFGNTIDFCGSALLMIVFGAILDGYPDVWRWLFMGASLLGLFSTYFLFRLPVTKEVEPVVVSSKPRINRLQEKLIEPWKQAWQLVSERPDFATYQIGFMIGGAALMILQPALPTFFVDTLNLSFTEMGIAMALCKGSGYAAATPLWTRLFGKINIFYLSGLVSLLAAMFPILLLAAPIHLTLLYVAYMLYGVMQAGSELSWHMSGLVFSQEKDSSAFSSTNVIAVGLRGCVIPALGAAMLPLASSAGVMMVGILLSLISASYLLYYSFMSAPVPVPEKGGRKD